MEEQRPYWKVIASLAISLTATVLFVLLGYWALGLLLPFVFGWGIACIANPMVCWLEKRLNIVKKLGSAITIILVLGVVVGVLYLIIASLVRQTAGLLGELPEIKAMVAVELNKILELLPGGMQKVLKALPKEIGGAAGSWLDKFGVVKTMGNVAKGIPAVLIGIIVTILSAYFFVAERDEVIAWVKKVTPKPIERRMSMVFAYLRDALGGYFKAQFQIMLVLSAMMFVGFLILGIKYAIVLALIFAILDFLPFFGTAITLIPWAVYELFTGDYKMAIGLVIIYILTQLTRQLIQPKLVGDGIGLKPLPTLVFLYIGYRIGSIWGMVLAVPVGMIVINMYKAGAFDYIADDVKVLVKGIQSLRE